MRIAVVDGQNAVVNVVTVADGPEWGWAPPPGTSAIASDTAGVGDTYLPALNTFVRTPQTLAAARQAALSAISAACAALLARGAPYAGRFLDATPGGRADLSGMAVTASLVLTGVIPAWPVSYAQGWIMTDGSRIPLPTPQDGIALAGTVGTWYANLMQYTQSAAEDALASQNPSSLTLDWSQF